jgi:hypothetical protein
MKRIFVILWVLLRPVPAFAWGPEGHEIVAAIAAANLTPAARAQVTALLGPPPMMVLESNWADEIRADRPETSAWHYVNVELGSLGYDARRDCPGGDCVVAQIARDMAVLGDVHAARVARIEALRFLIHFIGDVHQPLHVADDHDKGGNSRFLFLHGGRTNLHRIWDTDVVAALGSDPMRVAAGLEAGVTVQQKARDSAGTPASWANESFVAAGKIYAALPPGGDLPDDYARRQSPMVRSQLLNAGLRLAATLNRLLR